MTAGAWPDVPDPPDVSGLGPMPGAAVAFLWLMGEGEGREHAFDLETLERVDHYAVQVFACLGGSSACAITVAAVSAVHGRVGVAIRFKRERAAMREANLRASLQGGAAPGSGGARVPVAVGPSTRPPGGVGVALPMAAGADGGGGGQWSF